MNTHDWEIEERKSFEAVIQRPWDSPIWLDLVRGRWLLLQSVEFTVELWDLDAAEYYQPIATYVGLKGVINGAVHVEGTNGLEITLSTTPFAVYKFAPDLPYRSEVRAVEPTLTLFNSFQGYSSVKARRGQLLAFAESGGDRLRACIMDETTRSNVELSFGSEVMKWQAVLVTPQADLRDPTQRGYKIDNVSALGFGIEPIYGIRTGENGYRSAMLCYGRLSLHYGRPWEVPDNGEHYVAEAMEQDIDTSHTLVSWEIPDFEVDLPRPGCVAIDEAVGICIAAMGSGRIWIADAVPRVKPKRVDVAPLPNKTALPDPRWPELPPSYYWDNFYSGPQPLSKSDPIIDEIAPGWSTAVDHYWPWRNNPKAYGGILWFVENVMGLPGPATSLLFSTNALFESKRDILGLHEYVDIGGKIFWVLTNDDLVEVRSTIDGTTIDDVIAIKQKRQSRAITVEEELISDYMPIHQHLTWYSLFTHSRET
ncbi:hypothetical protein FRC05_009888 [Tulasnella sp. 425]|nr:hypothetical protein FRC05_009888 [Tulasnella sp. 425]